VTDSCILKGIKGPSVGNAFEFHVRRVRETRATRENASSQKKFGTVFNKLRVFTAHNILISKTISPTSLEMRPNSRVDPTFRS
jgi:hypothetical protein